MPNEKKRKRRRKLDGTESFAPDGWREAYTYDAGAKDNSNAWGWLLIKVMGAITLIVGVGFIFFLIRWVLTVGI